LSGLTERFAGRNLGIMSALMIGVFLSPLNVTMTSVALPTLQTDFEINVEQVALIGTAYFLPMVVLQPLQANLGQRYGLRRIYAIGLGLLSLGAFMAASANSYGFLLVSRVVQGIGWSAVYPLALILIGAHFAADRQGEMMGTWESAVGLAAIIGPVLGGLLLVYLDWPSIYVVIGLVAAAGVLLTMLKLPHREKREAPKRFDWIGALGLTVAMLIFLLALIRASWGLIALSLLAFVLWGLHARRTHHPFMDPRLLLNRGVVGASSAAAMRMIIGVGVLMSLPLFLEDVQGLSPLIVGLLLPVYSIFLMLGARPGGVWADRAGGRLPGATGFVLMTLGVAALLLLDTQVALLLLAAAFAVRGIGAGISQAPFAKVAIESAPSDQSGMAAGLYGMVRYSGLALGSVLVGLVLQSRFVHYGTNGTGAAAVPAFHELFAVLVLVGFVGLGFSLWMGHGKRASVPGAIQEVSSG
jgi:MFS family permease